MPRTYNLGLRLAAAEQTRARIISAARELLADDDFGGLSIDAIARRAGVARMTVYYQFASRRGLLEALYDDISSRGLLPNLPAVYEAASGREALDRLIEVLCRFWAYDRVVARRLHGLLAIDQEVEAGLLQRENRRKQTISQVLDRVAAEDGWEATVSVREAAGLIAVLSSFEAFDALAGAENAPEPVADLLKRSVAAILGGQA